MLNIIECQKEKMVMLKKNSREKSKSKLLTISENVVETKPLGFRIKKKKIKEKFTFRDWLVVKNAKRHKQKKNKRSYVNESCWKYNVTQLLELSILYRDISGKNMTDIRNSTSFYLNTTIHFSQDGRICDTKETTTTVSRGKVYLSIVGEIVFTFTRVAELD